MEDVGVSEITMDGFWQRKKVFITGHTGFKGSWLSLWLQSMGADVMGYALPPVTDPSLFELTGLGKRIRSVFGDIRDLQLLRDTYEGFRPDVVLHLAAQAVVRASYRDPVGTYATNVMGTVNMLETVRLAGHARVVVNVTSDKCYENREWAWGYRENEPMGGYDPYSSSKGCSELVTSAYRRCFFSRSTAANTVGIASGRAGNVIGGGDWGEDRLIPDCIRALVKGQSIIIRNPTSIRPWQHVLEPLSGYLLLAEKLWNDPSLYSEGWNFGPHTEDARPVGLIADAVTRAWGAGAKWIDVSAPGQPHEADYLKLDSTLARTRLGWEPKLGLEETLNWVVDWYQRYENGESALALTQEQISMYQALGSVQR
jgi:CDP-glucose 4,6-dehydratase